MDLIIEETGLDIFVLDINNGVIICWGLIANTVEHSWTLTFPTAYSSRYSMVVSDWSSVTNAPYIVPCGVYYTTNTSTTALINFYNNQPRGFGFIIIGS